MRKSYRSNERLATWKVMLPLRNGVLLNVCHAPDAVVRSLSRHDLKIDIQPVGGGDYDAIVEYGIRAKAPRAGYQMWRFLGIPAAMPRIWIDLATSASRRSGLSLHRPGRWFMRIALACMNVLARMTSHLPLPGVYVTIHKKEGRGIYSLLDEAALSQIGETCLYATLYSGSTDQNRKMTVRLCLASGQQVIAKIADTNEGNAAIFKEREALLWLAATGVSMQIPRVLGEPYEMNGAMVQFQTLLPEGRYAGALTPIHLQFLQTLCCASRRQMRVKDLPLYHVLQTTEFLKNVKGPNQESQSLDPWFDGQTEDEICERLQLLRANEETLITVCFAHGDFAPWNCMLSSSSPSSLFVYDWEDADPLAPIGVDIFHFLFRQAKLVGPWRGLPAIRDAWLSYMPSEVYEEVELYYSLVLLRALHSRKLVAL